MVVVPAAFAQQRQQGRALTLAEALELAEKRSESIGIARAGLASTSFKALGAIEFLRKPIDPEELYRVLCTVLAPQELAG